MPLSETAVRCLMTAQRDMAESLRFQAEMIGELAGSISDLTDAIGDYIAADHDDADRPAPVYDLEGKPIPRR